MRSFAVFAAFLQLVLSSHVAVRLPYLNPAGVSYVSGPSSHGAPLVGAPGPNLQFEHAQAYAQHPQAFEYAHHQEALQYAQHPEHLQYAAPVHAHVETHHVGYATAQVPAVAAVPVVKHVPAVADVPVTHIEAQHGFIEKQVDVAKPAVATRKFQVRRPAIQKHFYDIEERVIVRPAGSALVELDEPISKVQKGPTVVQPLAHAAPLSVTPVPDVHDLHHQHHEHQLLEHHQETVHVTPTPAFAHESVHVTHQTPVYGHENVHVTHQTPVYGHENVHVTHQTPVYGHDSVHVTPAPVLISSPAPVIVSSTPAPHFDEHDSVVVENVEFRNAVASLRQKERQLEDLQHQQHVLQAELQAERNAQVHSSYPSHHGVETHSNGVPHQNQIVRLSAHDPSPAIVPSVKASPEESKANQHKLIELLTARGGVAEVGFGRAGPATHVGDAGHVRARVLSATPTPDYAEPTGERVSTRRVVVSRPIETLQEFDVVEPATKVERVSYQQPTLIKTARTHRVQVPTSVPVYGKALAPAVAHAAVPVYQKTISHAPAEHGYYH